MPDISQRLAEALVAAYPDYLRRRITEEVPGLEEEIIAGADWLRESLEELLSRPFSEQHRGPLELFQAAMSFPTAALASAGVEPRRRDSVAASALPGDVYDLAPASSRDLGDEVWALHLSWGAAKARAVTDPSAPEGGAWR